MTTLQAAGLVDTLKGPGPFTVFAPTGAAFAAPPAGSVEDLLKPENKDKPVKVLTYHVVPGKVVSGDLTEGMKAKTVEGGELTLTLDGGTMVNGVTISGADVMASNGVIHVIDSVLLPPMQGQTKGGADPPPPGLAITATARLPDARASCAKPAPRRPARPARH